jgi:subtilisin
MIPLQVLNSSRPRRRLVAALGLLLLSALAAATVAHPGDQAAASAVRATYIVVLEDRADPVQAENRAIALGGKVTRQYRTALNGFAVDVPVSAISRLAALPGVRYVEADREVTVAHHACGHNSKTVGACYTVSGTVSGSGGTLAGATVAITGTSRTTTTDGSGLYSFSNLSSGTHTFEARAEGFQPSSATVSLSGNVSALNFELVPVSATEPTPTPTPTPVTDTVPWGVERVGAPLSINRGAGIRVYVIDTGIDLRHSDLAVSSEGFASESCRGGSCVRAWHDDNGHGTHVAGTIGALANGSGVVGVAPEVTLHAVKVLSKSGSGTRAGVIAGIDWVAQHRTGEARVANMSLGGSGSKTGTCSNGVFDGTDAYHQALCTATGTGVIFAVAAGNSGADAANSVPAAYHDTVITVSATAADSSWASWSNWGSRSVSGFPTDSAPVGIAAPGVTILSTAVGGGTTTMSGTSMASPHVAGVLALYLAAVTPKPSPSFAAFTGARSAVWAAGAATSTWPKLAGKPHSELFLTVPSP